MSLQRSIPWLILMLLASIAGMIIGGGAGRVWIVTLSAAAFSVAAIAVAIVANAPYWRRDRPPLSQDDAAIALRRNARLVAVAYAWGALAMQALYTTPLTGLKWQHGWQYSLLMLVLSLGAFHFAQGIAAPEPGRKARWLQSAVPLSIGNALLAAGGLVFLVASGKLFIRRSDWAANLVFVFGAITVMVLAAVTLRTHARLTRG